MTLVCPPVCANCVTRTTNPIEGDAVARLVNRLRKRLRAGGGERRETQPASWLLIADRAPHGGGGRSYPDGMRIQ
jgi:hypothetical protein